MNFIIFDKKFSNKLKYFKQMIVDSAMELELGLNLFLMARFKILIV